MKNLDDNLTVLAQLGDLLGCAHHASVTLDHIIGAPTNLTPALQQAIRDIETEVLTP
jgi:hypothetical protein